MATESTIQHTRRIVLWLVIGGGVAALTAVAAVAAFFVFVALPSMGFVGHVPAQKVAGTYRCTFDSGYDGELDYVTITLALRTDGNYTELSEYKDGRRTEQTGTWSVQYGEMTTEVMLTPLRNTDLKAGNPIPVGMGSGQGYPVCGPGVSALEVGDDRFRPVR